MKSPDTLVGVLARTAVLAGLLGAMTAHGIDAAAQSRPDGMKVATSPVTGLASFVAAPDGQPLPLRVSTKRARALDVLREYGPMFGVEDPERQLVPSREKIDRVGFRHTIFEQFHDGVRVYSGTIKVHQRANGNFYAANGDFYPVPRTLSTQPRFDRDEAVRFAEGVLSVAVEEVATSELVIVDPGWYGDPPRGVRLAWHLVLINATEGLQEGFFVDAHSGEILDQWNDQIHLLDRSIYTPSGSLPGVLQRAEGDPATGLLDVDRAYDFSGDAYGFWERGFGRDSIDDLGLPLRLTVNQSFGCPNAVWSAKSLQSVYCNAVVSDDVVGHELMHGIVQFTAGLLYQNESGMLNESFADIFGELVDLYNGDCAFAGPPAGPNWPPSGTGPGTDLPNDLRTVCSPQFDHVDGVRWLIAEDALGIGGALRDMWDPTCYGFPDKVSSPLQTCNPYDNGGVHSGSSIPNHAFAMLVDGKSFNGQTVTGIGPIKAAAIWFRALDVYFTPATSFSQASTYFQQAALDLIGVQPLDPRTGLASDAITATDAAEVTDAMAAVEMSLGGLACRGACCDQLAGTCEDYVLQVDCQGDFQAGLLCAYLQLTCLEPSENAEMVVLLDRTGSMETAIRATGNSRCDDALLQAKADVVDFTAGHPNRTVSVWTFTNSAAVNLTAGFVDQATALAALGTLDGAPCAGSTPLADAICQAASAFSPALPRTDKVLAISSDGEENSSTGPCSGTSSQMQPPPSGNYDVGSWQRNVLLTLATDQIVTVRHWGTFGIPLAAGETRVDAETGEAVGPFHGDAVFFQDIAGSSGGSYAEAEDTDETPIALVPTLSTWASLLAVLVLMATGSWAMRRRRSGGMPTA